MEEDQWKKTELIGFSDMCPEKVTIGMEEKGLPLYSHLAYNLQEK
ncbi:MAG: hypothetical protein WCC06_06710 [Candidatus Aminicenantales bacterium]